MAKCDICNREMNAADGCIAARLQYTPGSYDEDYNFSPDPKARVELFDRRPVENDAKCHDCGAKEGKYHHPGCDNERCPRCRGRLISCGCNESGMFADVVG